MKKLTEIACELCNSPGGDLLWQDDLCRIVSAADLDYPGFCRVILKSHVKEMTDLGPRERARLMEVVFALEAVLRELMQPDKINLASFGNGVPHLHWHVIPRFHDDRHFPNAVWAEPERAVAPARAAPDRARLTLALKARLS